MSVAQRKGDPGLADVLFSRLVRSRGRCEGCGDRQGPFDTAHIISRSYSATRCELDNAWCMCRTCHHTVDTWPEEKLDLVDRTIGRARYDEMRQTAHAFTSSRLSSKNFWAGEVERLTTLCRERGIDTRRRIPA